MMITLTHQQYEAIHTDYRGVWEDINGDKPEWKGKRTCFLGCIQKDGGTQMAVEGIHFNVLPPRQIQRRGRGR